MLLSVKRFITAISQLQSGRKSVSFSRKCNDPFCTEDKADMYFIHAHSSERLTARKEPF